MRLSPREMEVARLVAAGHPDKRIAADLGISQQRVSQIVNHIVAVWQLDATRNVRVQIATTFMKVA